MKHRYTFGRPVRSWHLGAILAASLIGFSPFSATHLRQSQTSPKPATAPAAAPSVPRPEVVPDLAQRVARFRRVKMPFNSMALTHNQRKMIIKLVDAAGLLDCIYWRQSDPQGLELYVSLAKSKDPQDVLLRHYLKINGSRFDLIDDNKPFVGTDPMPPGRGLFPEDMTREQFDAYVAAHPAQKALLYDPYTMVEGKDEFLETVPYHRAFKGFLDPIAQDLRDAADLSDDDPTFAKFLRLRANALLNDNYYPSDIAWLDLQNPKIDIVFAPYETYLDGLLGVKTSYGAAVMMRNEAESRKLAIFQKYVPDLQEALPLSPEDLPSKRGKQSPMEVMDAVYRAGDLLHGYQSVADNLPNDPRIHEQKGSKKIFWKNFMDARVNYVVLPLAQRVLRQSQAQMASGEGYLDVTMMHEIAHGLGPAFARTASGKIDINEAIGPQYSALEEAKADIVGMFCLKWLIDHGALPKEKEQAFHASYVAGIFRTVRFGIAEAHGAGEMMEFNYLVEQGAIRLAPGLGGLYEIDFDKMPTAIASLVKELLEQEATGDRARAEAWFKKYALMPPELSSALAKAQDIPVDIDPDFAFNPPVTLVPPAPAPPQAKEE
jgi:Peptidase family M49